MVFFAAMTTAEQELTYEPVPSVPVVMLRRSCRDGELVVVFRPYSHGKPSLPWRDESAEPPSVES